jgi:hypothetical protein
MPYWGTREQATKSSNNSILIRSQRCGANTIEHGATLLDIRLNKSITQDEYDSKRAN